MLDLKIFILLLLSVCQILTQKVDSVTHTRNNANGSQKPQGLKPNQQTSISESDPNHDDALMVKESVNPKAKGRKQKRLVVCPPDQIQIKKCTKRPDQKQCPTLFYAKQPTPVACGIRRDGTRVDFAQDCSACKDKSIKYYFSTPCHKIPFICSKTQECLGYYCGGSICLQDGDCPYDWQTCSNGKCVDPCIYRKCRDCYFGQCAYQKPYGQCQLNDSSKCINDWRCIVSQCGDRCWNRPCPAKYNCNKDNGQCQPQIL